HAEGKVDAQDCGDDEQDNQARAAVAAGGEEFAPFFGHNGGDVADHRAPSCINVIKTSSRLACPRRTSSIWTPAPTSAATMGAALAESRRLTMRWPFSMVALSTSGRAWSIDNTSGVKPSPTISACGRPV